MKWRLLIHWPRCAIIVAFSLLTIYPISAGAVGIGPTLAVLETAVLPLNDAPSTRRPSGRTRFQYTLRQPLFPGDARLLVDGRLAAPRAKLLEFDLPLHLFLILVGIVIPPFANGAAERDQVIRVFDLCHMGLIVRQTPKNCNCSAPRSRAFVYNI